MKTIFVALFQGYTARNFFYTDVFKTLKQRDDLRLVIFCLPLKADYYRQKFGSERVIIEAVEPIKEDGLRKHFKDLCYYSSPLHSIYIQIRRFYVTEGNFFKLVYRLFLNQIVSKIKLYRISLRWLDEKFFTTDCFKEYFIKYQPDLIYVPHFISPMDIELSKQAKKRGIFRVGMVNSWDNVSSRGLCRNLPDRMIGHNNIVKEHLVKYHDYNIKNIFVSGIPQFDIYFQEQRTPRKKFFERIGVEPNKKLVLFCPLGKRFSKTEYQVVKMLNQAIKDGRLQMNTHIFVRNNPVMNIYKSEEIEGLEHVTNEYPGKKFAGGGMNDWEFELDDIRHLADTLYHADVYVGCASTMVIDISSFNRPLIGINFDGNENLSFYQGVAWTFSSTHFKTIMETGGVSLANSETNLIELINKYLNNPELNKDNREKIIQEQYGAKDGKAGKRAGEYILKCLNELD